MSFWGKIGKLAVGVWAANVAAGGAVCVAVKDNPTLEWQGKPLSEMSREEAFAFGTIVSTVSCPLMLIFGSILLLGVIKNDPPR